MNLNEVKKHVKFDMFLTTLIYIMIAVCLFLALIFTLAIPAKAASNNINSYSHSTCGSSMGSGSYYGSFQNGTCYSRAIGTTYSGKTSLVGFWLNYNFQAGKYYTFTINFKDNDLISSTIVDVVRVVDVANNRNEWTATYNFISKKQFKVYFLAPNNSSSVAISLSSGSGDPITGVSNYGISSVYLEDNDNSDEIINANNQNTQNIINNNNANSQDTQNVIINTAGSIIDELANRCPNLFNVNSLIDCHLHNNSGDFSCAGSVTSLVPETGSVTFSPTGTWQGFGTNYYIPVTATNNYYLGFTKSDSYDGIVKISFYDSSYTYVSQTTWWNVSRSFTAPANASYMKISFENQLSTSFTISNIRLFSGVSDKTFCAFGSTISKLDIVENFLDLLHGDNTAIQDAAEEIKDLQQDSYNYLTDDTDPSVNQSGINNVLGSVNVQDPLNYLLTLPLNLLTKLNTVISSGTCSKASFGELYGTELYLPCINFENYLGSSLWGTIDTIVGIGLLAIILKKFYDTISNILSLGKEEEIRKGMELPTPMEFFAQILGGGR